MTWGASHRVHDPDRAVDEVAGKAVDGAVDEGEDGAVDRPVPDDVDRPVPDDRVERLGLHSLEEEVDDKQVEVQGSADNSHPVRDYRHDGVDKGSPEVR